MADRDRSEVEAAVERLRSLGDGPRDSVAFVRRGDLRTLLAELDRLRRFADQTKEPTP